MKTQALSVKNKLKKKWWPKPPLKMYTLEDYLIMSLPDLLSTTFGPAQTTSHV